MRASTLGRIVLSAAPLLLVACNVVGADDPGTTANAVNKANSPDAKQTAGATDIGCGGTLAPACADGKKCLVGKDCRSANCEQGVCGPPLPGAPPEGPPPDPNNHDGVKNGDESDVDCGGSSTAAPRCGDGKTCGDGTDCQSIVCAGGTCQAPTGTDGVKNGDETDVDCGGSSTDAPRCALGRQCKAHGDCGSSACAYNSKCVAVKSCAGHLGGDTCGTGEVGQPGANHVSCCSTASLPNSNAKIDKYLVTAGRMRTMIDRLNGNVRGFVQTLPGNQWNPGWNALVPSNKAEADIILGSYWAGAPNDAVGESKRSCYPGQFTGRTYWTTPTADDHSDFSRDQLDVKALNCVGWHLMTAFCAWDGGRLGTRAELAAAYTNGGSTTYPWGFKDNRAYVATQQDVRLNHFFSYNYPDVAGMRISGGNALDIAYHVSPPGRTPDGWNAQGVEIAGNLLTWVRDSEYFFTWNFSWENHTDNGLQAQSWLVTAPEAPNGYYALGGRCLHD